MSPDPLRAGGVWGRDYAGVGEEVVQVYGICIRTLHLPVISVMIISFYLFIFIQPNRSAKWEPVLVVRCI